MSLFQPSTLTFGNAKTQIAQLASKQNTAEFKTRAGDSIQKAVKYYNKYNWRWLMKQAPPIYLVASATSYDLPYDFKDVYSLRRADAGNQGAVVGLPRRVYDRVVSDHTSDTRLISYDLFTQGDQGKISLHPGTADCNTLDLRYYRRMWVPCAVTGVSGRSYGDDTGNGYATLYAIPSATVTAAGDNDAFAGITNGSPLVTYATGQGWSSIASWPDLPYAVLQGPRTLRIWDIENASGIILTATGLSFGGDDMLLDIPEDFENAILSWAAHHFLSQLGAPEGRLSYFIQLANDEFQEARAANERFEDQDIAFEYGKPNPYPHV